MDNVIALIIENANINQDNIILRINRRRIHDTADPFALSENEFRSLYR